MLVWGWLVVLFGWLFVMGSAVGSFLNVCIYRLPRGKNLFWPSSRCGSCLRPIRASDNMPLLAYWRLGGRCRKCGSTFSARYFLVELLVGVLFPGLYALEIAWNVHGLPAWTPSGFWYLGAGLFPAGSWPYFAAHATLASLLLVAVGCLLDGEAVPRGLVVFGAAVGLGWAVLFPWPEPAGQGYHRPPPVLAPGASWATAEAGPRPGFVPWPVWGPLPTSLPPGGLALGLLTGLAGVVLPAALVRLADLAGGGIGPAVPALLTLSGGFLGWQPLVVALALTVVCLPMRGRRWRTGRAMALMLGGNLVVAWLGWAWLGPLARRCLFDPAWLGVALAALTVGLVLLSRMLREPRRCHRFADEKSTL